MSIWSSLISLVNGKGWATIKEDAEAEDIVTAMKEGKSADEMKAALKEELKAEFEVQASTLNEKITGLETSVTDYQTKLTTVTSEKEALQDTVNKNIISLADMKTEKEKLELDNKALSGRLAGMLVKGEDTKDAPPLIPVTSSAAAFAKKGNELAEKAREKNK